MLQMLIFYVVNAIFRCCDGLPERPMGIFSIGRPDASSAVFKKDTDRVLSHY
jgi:hypothetical protein